MPTKFSYLKSRKIKVDFLSFIKIILFLSSRILLINFWFLEGTQFFSLLVYVAVEYFYAQKVLKRYERNIRICFTEIFIMGIDYVSKDFKRDSSVSRCINNIRTQRSIWILHEKFRRQGSSEKKTFRVYEKQSQLLKAWNCFALLYWWSFVWFWLINQLFNNLPLLHFDYFIVSQPQYWFNWIRDRFRRTVFARIAFEDDFFDPHLPLTISPFCLHRKIR
jgi:hypothetical protein